jgi:alpha-1,2-mannosyltransferase
VSARLGTLSPPGIPSRASLRRSPGAAMLAATLVALGIRLYTLSRPGFLTSPTEYDDGVYLGAAIRMTQGVMPYHDFAFVQPPGILLLMSPAALVARVTSPAAALALARLLTVLASMACVPLAGNLVRHRGALATALTCGILAVYPPDIASAHTLLLEPWMNLLCLLGANAAFTGGRLATRPRRLAWAGIAIGFASVVKFWAMAPAAVLLAVCLLDRTGGGRQAVKRTVAYLAGLAGAFVVPLAPFMAYGPGLFFRSTVQYQAARVGTYTPLSLRLAHITGLIDVLNYYGHLAWAGANSLFGQAVLADTAPATPPLVLPLLAALVLAALVAAGFVTGRRDISQAEWFALFTAVLALGAIGVYSAFFYHYPAFPGPWLAIVTGVALWRLITRVKISFRRVAAGLVAVVLAAAAVVQLTEVAQVTLPAGSERITSMIPPGACVVTDETSLVISADRFDAARPGCPVVIDALATTLVLTHGISVQGGANHNAAAIAAWQRTLLRARYVWLSPNHWRRIPFGWNTSQWAWFTAHFEQVVPKKPGDWIRGVGQLFVRRM